MKKVVIFYSFFVVEDCKNFNCVVYSLFFLTKFVRLLLTIDLVDCQSDIYTKPNIFYIEIFT